MAFKYRLETPDAKRTGEIKGFLSSIDRYYGLDRYDISDKPSLCLAEFFDDEGTKALVEAENWDGVFAYWEPFLAAHDKTNWVCDILGDFLYLLDIHFWEYFTQPLSHYSDKYLLDGLYEE